MKIIQVIIISISLSVLSIACIPRYHHNIAPETVQDGEWIVSKDGKEHYTTIQEAIDAPTTVDGDTVVIYDGTYFERINFNGKAITLRSLNGPASTIIDGEGGGPDFGGSPVVHCNHGEGLDSVIDGLTIQNGSFYYGGGGISLYRSSALIRNCIIRNNNGRGNGTGGIWCGERCSAIIENCIIENNQGGHSGQGGVTFVNNPYVNNPQPPLPFIRTTPRLKNSIVRDNVAQRYGGGVYVGDGTDVIISGCSILNNHANWNGGGILTGGRDEGEQKSYAKIINTVVAGNTASKGGIFPGTSGLWLWSHSTVSVINSTFVDNNPYNIFMSGGSPTATDGSTLTMKNSISWDYPICNRTGNLSISYSNVQSVIKDVILSPPTPEWVDEGGNISVQPLLDETYHLMDNSPCLDAGNSDAAPVDDIDGDRRPQGAGIDIGADEFFDK